MSDDKEDKQDHWSDDLLKRRNDAAFLVEFLKKRVAERQGNGIKTSYVVNLDARYGEGKSFFLQRLRRDLEQTNAVAYVNAWEDDYADDPLIPVMAALEQAYGGKAKKAAKSVAKRAGEIAAIIGKHSALTLGRRVLGDGVNEMAEALDIELSNDTRKAASGAFGEAVSKVGDAAFARFALAKKSIEEFKKELSKLVASNPARSPLFVLVDELDRCRPTYAIQVLERIKHLFDIDNIIFIIATDTSQLRHAISSVYGNGFDASGYLLRFFDRTYKFPPVTPEQFIHRQFELNQIAADRLSSPPNGEHAAFLCKQVNLFGLHLREVERCCDILRSCITNYPPDKSGVRLQLTYLFPLIIAHVRNDVELFERLAEGSFSDAEEVRPNIRRRQFIEFPRATDFGQPLKPERVDLRTLIFRFAVSAQKPLSQTTQEKDWVSRQFSAELSAYGGSYLSNSSPNSICRQYPALVRSVAQLEKPNT